MFNSRDNSGPLLIPHNQVGGSQQEELVPHSSRETYLSSLRQQNRHQIKCNIIALWFMAIFLATFPFHIHILTFPFVTIQEAKSLAYPFQLFALRTLHSLCKSSQRTTLKEGNKNFKSLKAEIKLHFDRHSKRLAFAIILAYNSRLVKVGSFRRTQQRTGRKCSQRNYIAWNCSITPR